MRRGLCPGRRALPVHSTQPVPSAHSPGGEGGVAGSPWMVGRDVEATATCAAPALSWGSGVCMFRPRCDTCGRLVGGGFSQAVCRGKQVGGSEEESGLQELQGTESPCASSCSMSHPRGGQATRPPGERGPSQGPRLLVQSG